MVTPVLRGLIAPTAALAGASLLLVYLASCSSDKDGKQPKVPEGPSALEKAAGDEPEALPKVGKLQLPALPERRMPQLPAGETGPTVAEVLDEGCSTTVVMGLSEQIVAEANCLVPGAYAKLPALSNVTLSNAVFPYMQEPARDALVRAVEKAKERPMKVNSMLRTVAQQYLLYDWYLRKRCGIKLAAEPGSSNHQSGLAIDISEPGNWRKTLDSSGFRWMGKKDPWHFDYRGKGSEDHAGLDVKAFQRLWNRNHPDEPVGDDGDFGPDTEAALRRAPAGGFPLGASCDAP
jgi:hypothetical protein